MNGRGHSVPLSYFIVFAEVGVVGVWKQGEQEEKEGRDGLCANNRPHSQSPHRGQPLP